MADELPADDVTNAGGSPGLIPSSPPAPIDPEAAQRAEAAEARRVAPLGRTRVRPQETVTTETRPVPPGGNFFDQFDGLPQDNGYDIAERKRLNRIDAYYRNTIPGALRLKMLSDLYKTEDGPEVDPDRRKVNDDLRKEYRKIVADLAAYEQMRPWETSLEGLVSLQAQLEGTMVDPTNWIGWGAGGKTIARRLFSAGAQQAGISVATDPIIQNLNISAGVQEDYEWAKTAAAFVFGFGMGAIGQGIGEMAGQLMVRQQMKELAKLDSAFANSIIERELVQPERSAEAMPRPGAEPSVEPPVVAPGRTTTPTRPETFPEDAVYIGKNSDGKDLWQTPAGHRMYLGDDGISHQTMGAGGLMTDQHLTAEELARGERPRTPEPPPAPGEAEALDRLKARAAELKQEAVDAVPDSAFNGDTLYSLEQIFGDNNDRVPLPNMGFRPDEIAAMEKAGFATDGVMTREQFYAFVEERNARMKARAEKAMAQPKKAPEPTEAPAPTEGNVTIEVPTWLQANEIPAVDFATAARDVSDRIMAESARRRRMERADMIERGEDPPIEDGRLNRDRADEQARWEVFEQEIPGAKAYMDNDRLLDRMDQNEILVGYMQGRSAGLTPTEAFTRAIDRWAERGERIALQSAWMDEVLYQDMLAFDRAEASRMGSTGGLDRMMEGGKLGNLRIGVGDEVRWPASTEGFLERPFLMEENFGRTDQDIPFPGEPAGRAGGDVSQAGREAPQAPGEPAGSRAPAGDGRGPTAEGASPADGANRVTPQDRVIQLMARVRQLEDSLFQLGPMTDPASQRIAAQHRQDLLAADKELAAALEKLGPEERAQVEGTAAPADRGPDAQRWPVDEPLMWEIGPNDPYPRKVKITGPMQTHGDNSFYPVLTGAGESLAPVERLRVPTPEEMRTHPFERTAPVDLAKEPPAEPVSLVAIPNTAFQRDTATWLRQSFQTGGVSVRLADIGMHADDIAALERSGLADAGVMSREQYAVYLAEMEARQQAKAAERRAKEAKDEEAKAGEARTEGAVREAGQDQAAQAPGGTGAGPDTGAGGGNAQGRGNVGGYADTRGAGTQYHGSGDPDLVPDSSHYSSLNYYGQGFYSTDAVDIGSGYARSKRARKFGGQPTLYRVEETRPLNILDGEAPIPPEVMDVIKPVADYNGTPLGDVLLAAEGHNPKNMRELYDAIRDEGTAEGYSADVIQEVFDGINYALREIGYDGFSHTGGLRTGKEPHRVVIYFDPDKDIRLVKEDWATHQAKPEAAPTPAGEAKAEAPKETFQQQIERLKAERAPAENLVRTAIAEENPKLVLEGPDGRMLVLTRGTEDAPYRLTSFDKDGPTGHRDYLGEGKGLFGIDGMVQEVQMALKQGYTVRQEAPAAAAPAVQTERPVLEGEARKAKVEERKKVLAEYKALGAKGGLTKEEGAAFAAKGRELAALDYELARPGDPKVVASPEDAKSALLPETVAIIYDDTLRSQPIFMALREAADGVAFNAKTAIDNIMAGQNPDIPATALYDAFAATRDALRAQFGDTITLYRSEGQQMAKETQNWATTREFAEQFGGNIKTAQVPVDNIVGAFVNRNGKYHELIVGTPPERPALKTERAAQGEQAPAPTEAPVDVSPEHARDRTNLDNWKTSQSTHLLNAYLERPSKPITLTSPFGEKATISRDNKKDLPFGITVSSEGRIVKSMRFDKDGLLGDGRKLLEDLLLAGFESPTLTHDGLPARTSATGAKVPATYKGQKVTIVESAPLRLREGDSRFSYRIRTADGAEMYVPREDVKVDEVRGLGSSAAHSTFEIYEGMTDKQVERHLRMATTMEAEAAVRERYKEGTATLAELEKAEQAASDARFESTGTRLFRERRPGESKAAYDAASAAFYAENPIGGKPELATERTAQGEQTLMPGVEPVTDKAKAEAGMNKPLRGGNADMPEGGLFDEGARAQTDLFGLTGDTANRPDLDAAARGEAPAADVDALAQRKGGEGLWNEQQRPAGGVPDVPSERTRLTLQSLQQQVMNLAEALGIPVRQGRVEIRGALGTFNNRTGIARVKEIADLEVVAHEAAHGIERRIGQPLTDLTNSFSHELARLDYDQTKMRVNEGFAEWVRILIGDPDKARQLAPGFFPAFNLFLERRAPDILAAIESATNAFKAYNTASSVDVIRASRRSVSEEGLWNQTARQVAEDGLPSTILSMVQAAPTQLLKGFQTAYRALLDNVAPVERAVREASQSIRSLEGGLFNLNAADNPAVLMRLLERSQQAAVRDMIDGPYGYHSVVPGQFPLTDALVEATGQPSKMGKWNKERVELFSAYLIARRAEYLWRRFEAGDLPNPPAAFSREDALRTIADLEREFPTFRSASDKVHGYTRELLKKQFDGGLITRDLYDELLSHEFYVPFRRDRSDVPTVGTGGAAGLSPGDVQTVSRMRGSSRDILDPIESLMQQTFMVNRVLRHNDVMLAWARLAERAGPEGGRFFEPLPAHEARKYVTNLEELIEKKAAEIGMDKAEAKAFIQTMQDLSGEDPVMGSYFKMQQTATGGEPIIFYREGGELRAARVMSGKEGHALYETLMQAPPVLNDIFQQVIAPAAAALRVGITSEPTFILSNYIRDQLAAFLLRPDYIPFVTGMKGLVEEARQGQMAKLYAVAGGVSGGASVGPVDRAVSREIDALAKRGFAVNRLTSLSGLMELASFTEAGTRNSIFAEVYAQKLRQGLSEYDAMIEAAFNAQDLIDFGRHGSHTFAIRSMVPFLNATLQGLDKANRTAIEPIVRWGLGREATLQDRAELKNAGILWAKMGITAGLGAMWAAINWDKEAYRNASPELKGTHFIVPWGNQLAVMPKPFELSLGFTLGEAAYQRLMGEDPRAATMFAESAWEVLVPKGNLAGITPTMELRLGKSLYTGKDIVPDTLKGLPPEMQYTDRTSEISKWIGKQIGVSPMKVEYGIGAYFGTWGRNVAAMSQGLDEDAPEAQLADRAFFRRYIKDPTRSSAATRQFWDFMSKSTGKFNQADAAYDALVKGFRDDQARAFLNTLPGAQRAYVTLKSAADENGKPAFDADQKRLHPLARAYDAVTMLNGVRSELASNTFSKWENRVPQKLPPDVRRDLLENVRALSQAEMYNSLIIAREPGYANQPMIQTNDFMVRIRHLSPEVADEIATRYATQKIYKTEAVAKVWPKVERELLRFGSRAELMGIAMDVRSEGYAFDGDRVRKPQKRRVNVPGTQ